MSIKFRHRLPSPRRYRVHDAGGLPFVTVSYHGERSRARPIPARGRACRRSCARRAFRLRPGMTRPRRPIGNVPTLRNCSGVPIGFGAVRPATPSRMPRPRHHDRTRERTWSNRRRPHRPGTSPQGHVSRPPTSEPSRRDIASSGSAAGGGQPMGGLVSTARGEALLPPPGAASPRAGSSCSSVVSPICNRSLSVASRPPWRPRPTHTALHPDRRSTTPRSRTVPGNPEIGAVSPPRQRSGRSPAHLSACGTAHGPARPRRRRAPARTRTGRGGATTAGTPRLEAEPRGDAIKR